MCGCLLCTPYQGSGSQPRHVPWTVNLSGDPLVRRMALNPLNYTSQGSSHILFKIDIILPYPHFHYFKKIGEVEVQGH